MAHAATREEHPLPAILMHWVHLISILVLIFTGFYIHRPFFAGGMGTVRALHLVFMFVVILTAVVRVYWAFLGAGSASSGERVKVRDYTFFGLQRQNRGQLLETVKYYLFLRRTHPTTAKYNPLQKGTYVLWLVLIAVQALTGFALWTPTATALQPLTYALGGVVYVREYHYLIMWLFIVTVALHVYLSLAEAIWEFPAMLWGRQTGPRQPSTADE